ncbi:D-alanyl-D-alanine carboxypeptidase family protein [Phaeovulum vinaykumarii]|uniref:serine-type D-Ala-D-Ala carboxypeptidase n=1 Tax=Phaeovulum vinaykumarii TaxID=407234 RepID=A0A1N7MGU3_9RHOB|nr:D-alanyl-D-alanine carboxypeptidase family protein [Phaeovulum vinaykumarii]SIS85250.1 D-alanyl-D-alanine carboxypeptidase (penicillin-binding protein 5/6) [Phaeovulum vinaykumarii]SOC12160.1 D-alanyl-D-alanine carboxypeptidase (penicillin-binding protein 5/6) [Phaeovulum vinaykumarii]
MPTPFRQILTVLALILALPSAALAFDTRASAAWVYDVATQTVLLEKNADVPLPPASMSKLMTIDMLFEALRDGRVTLDTRFPVSTRARMMGGSTMFLNETDRPRVEDLIKGIVVLSGNDACVVVAEGLGGTEDNFARLMTERAHALGMKNSIFANASGWPAPGHRMSMRDLGTLALRLITEFPEYYHYFSIREFPYDNRAPDNRHNRNPLLGLGIGADGLKTGHTSEAGYGLVGSAVQGERRIVFVISGMDSERARAEEAERIVNWAFRQFALKTVATQGDELAQAPVWLGEAESVPLVMAGDLRLLVPALAQEGLKATVSYDGPIPAPIRAGQPIATLRIETPDVPGQREVALVAGRDVAAGGPWVRVKAAAERLWAQALIAAGATGVVGQPGALPVQPGAVSGS